MARTGASLPPRSSFELERCVDIIVNRQLARPYLAGNSAREEQRIRKRFPLFIALQCTRFQTDVSPILVASEIARFAREATSMSRATP